MVQHPALSLYPHILGPLDKSVQIPLWRQSPSNPELLRPFLEQRVGNLHRFLRCLKQFIHYTAETSRNTLEKFLNRFFPKKTHCQAKTTKRTFFFSVVAGTAVLRVPFLGACSRQEGNTSILPLTNSRKAKKRNPEASEICKRGPTSSPCPRARVRWRSGGTVAKLAHEKLFLHRQPPFSSGKPLTLTLGLTLTLTLKASLGTASLSRIEPGRVVENLPGCTENSMTDYKREYVSNFF